MVQRRPLQEDSPPVVFRTPAGSRRLCPGAAACTAAVWALAAFLALAPARAEPEAGNAGIALAPYDISCWTTDNGLPQNSVNDLVQSLEGYLWIATYNGLARFDGVRFLVYDKSNTPAFVHNAVNCLHLDVAGVLWIGTSGGVVRWRRGGSPEFEPVPQLAGQTVLSLCGDGSGSLWVGTTDGLWQVGAGGVTRRFGVREGLPAAPISNLQDAGAEGLWIGSLGGGAGRFSGGRYYPLTTREGLPDDNIHALFRDRDGNLWIGTESGLVRRNRDGLAVFSTADGLADSDIRAIFRDRRRRLWVGTNKGGVNRRDKDLFLPVPLKSFTANDSPRSFLEDREGSLWIGFKGGLVQLKPGKFQTFDRRRGLPADEVRAVVQDRDGGLWIGTVGSGLVHFDGAGFTVYGRESGLLNDRVWSLSLAPNGDLWLGTYGGGAYRFSGGKFERFDRSRGLSSDSVRVVYADSRGWVWVGTNGGGLNVIRDGRIDRYTAADGLAGDIIYAVAESPPGTIWVGAFSGGLSRLENGRITTFGKEAGLREHAVWALHPDAAGNLWIGTNEHGLVRFRDGQCRYFTTADGMAEDIAFQVLEDDSGALWMNGNAGLYRVGKEDLLRYERGEITRIPSQTLGKADGFPNLSCGGPGQPAGCRGTEGRFWFATARGVVAINPRRIPVNRVAPQLIVDKVTIDETEYSGNDLIEAPPGDGNVEISYTGASFISPERMLFQYRLEGYDRDWVKAGTRRAAFYTNLPPGEYTFHVIACNGDGLWNWEGVRLKFRIRPFYYQTVWFYAGLVCLMALCLWTYHGWRVRNMRARARRLQALVDERTRELDAARRELEAQNAKLRELDRLKTEFLAAVSHELRTPITSIFGFAKVTQKQFQKISAALDEHVTDPTVRGHIPKVGANLDIITVEGERLVRLISDGLDLTKIEAGLMQWNDADWDAAELLALAARAVQGFFIEHREPRFLVEIEEVRRTVRTDRDRFVQVVSNLVSNAAKHTTRGHVRLSARADSDRLRVSVEDTGAGIPAEECGRVFDKFYQSVRPDTRTSRGSGLGLFICRQIVEHYGGAIGVESRPGQGSRFFFDVPLLPIPRDAEAPPQA